MGQQNISLIPPVVSFNYDHNPNPAKMDTYQTQQLSIFKEAAQRTRRKIRRLLLQLLQLLLLQFQLLFSNLNNPVSKCFDSAGIQQ